jgi:chromosome segregation ATPase
MSKTIIGSFVNGFAALIQGDTATNQAEKAWRQAQSGLKTEIAKLQGSTISFEDNVEVAEEALSAATLNGGKLIEDRHDYVQNILTCKATLMQKQKELANHQANLEFLEETLESLSTEKPVKKA